ncbi:hypothetical protein BJX61DRAFT_502304 [Aspergillus egyptiacus]|nr:hypothetical protein BJX61DRAFT_502304 [Aspergillus egyptiacus]
MDALYVVGPCPAPSPVPRYLHPATLPTYLPTYLRSLVTLLAFNHALMQNPIFDFAEPCLPSRSHHLSRL